jgi:rod shape determining protein RodA
MNSNSLKERIDWITILLFTLISLIGVYAIFSVEYKGGDLFDTTGKSYNKQLMWLGFSLIAGFAITLMDSRTFSNLSFGSYAVGFLLLVIVLFFHDNVKGSKSWLPLGFMRFQPGELMKIFVALSLSKFISTQGINFAHNTKHRMLALAITFLPCLLVILSNETGLALVYFSFLLAMYREGLPRAILIVGLSIGLLGILTLVLDKTVLFYVLTSLLVIEFIALRKQIARSRELLIVSVAVWLMAVGFSQFAVPYAFKNVLKSYQVDRIYTMLGKDVPQEYIKKDASGEDVKMGGSDYNVKQSKIAIGSGGFWGKGPLNGTQTSGNFVPEQRTDFIFCSIGEQFGFFGSIILIGLYLGLLYRIIFVAERQKSKFSRIYAYCVAGILFFHLAINVSMTMGLAPVIGIPLPMLSYGGTSLLTFAAMIFILVRLDADRMSVIR